MKLELKNINKSYGSTKVLENINFQLNNLGLNEIYNIKKDTYLNESLFFSHRRSIHKGEKSSGRLIPGFSISPITLYPNPN